MICLRRWQPHKEGPPATGAGFLESWETVMILEYVIAGLLAAGILLTYSLLRAS